MKRSLFCRNFPVRIIPTAFRKKVAWVNMQFVIDAICGAIGVTRQEFFRGRMKGRTEDITNARGIFCLICRDYYGMTLNKTALLLGTDHTTIYRLRKNAPSHIEQSEWLNKVYERIKKLCQTVA
jgi:chromosomal replication initiation ATPase DnaA